MIATASAAHAQWQQLGPPGGYVSDIAATANRLHAYGGHRLFSGDADGTSWREIARPPDCISADAPLASRAVQDGTHLYLQCWSIMRSVDDGASWSAYGPPGMASPIAFHPTVNARAAITGVDNTPFVGVTFDDGANWTLQFSDPGVPAPGLIAYDPASVDRMVGVGMNARTAFDATGRINLYPVESFESLDNGRTWTVTGTLVPASAKLYCFPGQFAFDLARRQYVHTYCGFFRSGDGRTWERMATFPFDTMGTIAVDAAATGRVLAFDNDELFESVDAGSTWQPLVPPPGDLFRVAFATGGRLWFATTEGVFIREPGGTAWRLSSDGLNAWPMKHVEAAVNGPVVTALADTGAPNLNVQSLDGGLTWDAFAPAGEHVVELSRNVSDASSLLALSASQKLYRSGDGGRTWQLAASGVVLPAGTKFARAVPVGPQPGVVWAVYTTCVANGFLGCFDLPQGVIRSTDGGQTWPIASAIEQSSSGHVVPSVDPRIAMAAMFSGVYLTLDAGATWQKVLDAVNPRVVGDPVDPARWYVFGFGVGLRTTTDFGTTWTRLSDPVTATPRYDLLVDAKNRDRLFAVGLHAEVNESTDRGATWLQVVEPSPLLRLGLPSARLGPEAATTIYAAGVQGVLKFVVPGSPAGTVRAIEYWHEALAHYFITADDNEIWLLDAQLFAGWIRTGESIDVYPPGAGTPEGASPVCRYYGRPVPGFDTHFYSASPAECQAVADRFGDVWQLESPEVFALRRPDPVDGSCPEGSKPVYRFFNSRADVNHRYVTSAALRATMLARGWVPEGYGGLGVAMCSP